MHRYTPDRDLAGEKRNKDGTEVRYLQLAHNVWDPAAKRSRVQVVYNFGREDASNRDALQRLVASVSRSWIQPRRWPHQPPAGWSSPSPGRWAEHGFWTPCGPGLGSPPS